MSKQHQNPDWTNLPVFTNDSDAVRFFQRFGEVRYVETAAKDPTCHSYTFTSFDGAIRRKITIWENGSIFIPR